MIKIFLKNNLIKLTLIPSILFIFLSGVASAKLIEINVEIAEINTDKAQDLGIKWIDNISGETVNMGAGETAYSNKDGKPTYLPELPSLFEVGEIHRYNAFAADINLMIEEGAAEITSKPKLVTQSGTEASFSAGGEFPVVS
nr:hypothetical protein [Elusimicrobiota bacterium]